MRYAGGGNDVPYPLSLLYVITDHVYFSLNKIKNASIYNHSH
jgi:hypothetical protein